MKDKSEQLWNRDFIHILIVQFCIQMGQQMMNSLVPKFADALGGSAYIVGLVSSVFSISAILILVVATPAFDCLSKKKLLIVSLGGMALAFAGYGMSTTIPALFAFRLMHGICQGCSSALTLVMVGDSLPASKMGKGIGIFTLCQAVGQAVGPGFGLSMSASIGYRVTFLIGAAVMALAFLFSFRIREGEKPKGVYRIALNRIIDWGAVPAAVVTFLLQGPYCCISSFIAIYAGLRNVPDIGLYFTVYALCLLVTRPISGAMIDKIGHDLVLIFGIVCFGISFFLISIAQSLIVFLAAAVVSALGYGVCQPTLNYMCISCAPKSHRGAASSTNSIGMSLGFFLGVSSAGYLVDWLNARMGSEVAAYSNMYLIMILPMAVALIYFLIMRRRIAQSIQQYSAA